MLVVAVEAAVRRDQNVSVARMLALSERSVECVAILARHCRVEKDEVGNDQSQQSERLPRVSRNCHPATEFRGEERLVKAGETGVFFHYEDLFLGGIRGCMHKSVIPFEGSESL